MTEYKLSLNQFPVQHLSTEAVLAQAAAVGFEGVGLAMGPTVELGAAAVSALLRKYRLSATSLCVAMDVIGAGPDRAEECAARLAGAMALADAVDAPLVAMVGHPHGIGEQAVGELAQVLSRLAAGRGDGRRLLVEPLTPVLAGLTPLTSLRATRALLAAAPSVDWVLDAWHSWCDPELIDLLPELTSRCQIVHLSDYVLSPQAPLARDYPGNGSINFDAIISLLREGDFHGWFEAEVLFAEPVSEDGLAAYVQNCRDSLQSVLEFRQAAHAS